MDEKSLSEILLTDEEITPFCHDEGDYDVGGMVADVEGLLKAQAVKAINWAYQEEAAILDRLYALDADAVRQWIFNKWPRGIGLFG